VKTFSQPLSCHMHRHKTDRLTADSRQTQTLPDPTVCAIGTPLCNKNQWWCSSRWDESLWTAVTSELIVFPHVIYEHGEPWWNDINSGELLIRQPEFSGNLPAESSSRKSGGTGEGSDEFCLTNYLFHASKGFLICRKILDMEPTALLPLRRKSCCGSWSPLKNLSPSAGLEPANIGSNTRHANHYTTEDDLWCVTPRSSKTCAKADTCFHHLTWKNVCITTWHNSLSHDGLV
jgi:hypothetical protein